MLRNPSLRQHQPQPLVRRLLWLLFIVVPFVLVSGWVLFALNMKMEGNASAITEADKSTSSTTPSPPQSQLSQPQPAQDPTTSTSTSTSSRVHIFYYPWWGTPDNPGKWLHWNHRILEGKMDQRLEPEADIGANYYPASGLYSSADRATIERHMREIREAGVSLLSYSWYPQGLGDDEIVLAGEGGYSDAILPNLLDEAEKAGVQVSIHVEPIKDITAQAMREHLTTLIGRVGKHPALYRLGGRLLFWMYDSYLMATSEWARLLKKGGDLSIRDTPIDIVALGLLVDERHKAEIVAGGWDGWYSYFGTDGFTYGSSVANWKDIVSWSRENRLVSVLCVAPGYDDTRIRPWNKQNRRSRENGKYYDRMWQAAIDAKPDFIGITSYNEFHEGTQIEPAKTTAEAKRHGSSFDYSDYEPLVPDGYLAATLRWTRVYAKAKSM